MKKLLVYIFVSSLSLSCANNTLRFKQHSPNEVVSYGSDWLISSVGQPVQLYEKNGEANKSDLILSNSLISRTFRLFPNAATTGFDNLMTGFFSWCRARGIYINDPDWYMLTGANKTDMTYKEENNALPRDRQHILFRQNIYDGTWNKTPSMGWMFAALVDYKGGGAEAIMEPLNEHLDTYQWHLAQNFGSGVQACYRGPRLYDTEETKTVVKKWVDFYKKYREILDSDIIHVRRPDGRDIDCILHVNPKLEHKGLAMIYNPTSRRIKRQLTLPLFYTGIQKTAGIRREEGKAEKYMLDRQYNVKIEIDMEPDSYTWLVIESKD